MNKIGKIVSAEYQEQKERIADTSKTMKQFVLLDDLRKTMDMVHLEDLEIKIDLAILKIYEFEVIDE